MSNEFEKRLYDFELNPPATTWDKILLVLNKQVTTEEFPEKLYNLQVQPPADVWQKISLKLNQAIGGERPERFIERIKPFYRYAAAAMMIGIITFLVSLFINKQNIANIAKEQTVPDSKQNIISPQNRNTVNNSSKNETGKVTNQIPESNKKPLIASAFNNERKNLEELFKSKIINVKPKYRSPATLQTNYSADNLEIDAEYLDYSSPAITYDQSRISHINTYFVLLRPDGNIIRVSKKFADMIGCMYNSSSNSSNENCGDQINTWRKKMAKSHVSPSQDNFMDILTLIKSLQEN